MYLFGSLSSVRMVSGKVINFRTQELLTIVKPEFIQFVNLNQVRVATDLPNPNQEEINFWEKVIQNGKEVRKEVQWIKKESLLFGKPTVEGSFNEI